VKSHSSKRFHKAFKELPKRVQSQAKRAYKLFLANPYHPSLRFKQVHPTKPIYSVRISRDYRAVGVREGDEMVWFWIGLHREYEKIIAQL